MQSFMQTFLKLPADKEDTVILFILFVLGIAA